MSKTITLTYEEYEDAVWRAADKQADIPGHERSEDETALFSIILGVELFGTRQGKEDEQT